MALPRTVVRGKEVILLSGFTSSVGKATGTDKAVKIDAEDKLKLAAKRDPDAVAFGYVAGLWIAAA